MNSKEVKKLISDKMTDRKRGITVVHGDNDDEIDRIEIKYPKGDYHLTLNPIKEIIEKHGFHVAQLINFYYDNKMVCLLIRDRRPTINYGKRK